jgi:anti-sigma B factor antagonist
VERTIVTPTNTIRSVEHEDHGDVTVVRVNLPMLRDDEETGSVFDALYALVEGTGRRKFVLDVGAIQYFASAALGKLMTLNRKVREADARLVLCRVTPTVERILQVTRLSDLLLSYDNDRLAREGLA